MENNYTHFEYKLISRDIDCAIEQIIAFLEKRKTDSKGFANFGLSFAQVIYKPSVGILYFSSAVFAAEAFGTSVSTVWFVTAFIMSIILSIATPPISGGAIASISVLFTQLGLPTEGLAIVLALNIILDFIETPVDNLGSHAMTILSAKKAGMIDCNKLKS